MRISRLTRTAVPTAAVAMLLCALAAPPATATTGTAQKEQAAKAAFESTRFGSMITNGTSPNWSGYVDTNYKSNGKFTTINGQWNVPQVAPAPSDCTAGTFATGTGYAGFWVGLDGWGDGTVEQTGTVTECYQGSAYYWDWYEMYPNPPVVVGTVNPGDRIAAGVTNSGGSYLLAINDLTTGASNSVLEPCPGGSTCKDRSAEVIAEAPGGCVSGPGQACRGSLYPLPDFRYVAFHGISVATTTNGGGIGWNGFGPLDLTMVNSAHIKLAVVSVTIHSGAFTDSWRASG